MKKLAVSLTILIASGVAASAQSAADLIRLSQNYPTGTARSMAMGGAFGALGADLSSADLNPAGLGLFRKSEISFTPMFTTDKTSFDLMDRYSEDKRRTLVFNHFGISSTIDLADRGLKNLTWSLGYSRTADFNQDLSWNTYNATSSILDEFTASANNGGDPLLPDALSRYGHMAFNVFAVDTCYFFGANPGTGQYDEEPYYHDMLGVYNQYMARSITRRGSIKETYMALGFNVSDIFYFGATLGLQDVYFKEKTTHHEMPGVQAEYMRYYRMVDKFVTDGWGVNVKLGAIIRPVPEIRFGLAYHSPTWFSLESRSYLAMNTRFKNSPTHTGDLDFEDWNENVFKYDMKTPGRFLASWACVIPSTGIISVDYEFIDYGNAKMKAKYDRAFANGVTDDVKQQYRATGNLRIGSEVLVSQRFSIRAGFANLGNPARKGYFNGDQKDQQFVSAGFGFRGEDAYIDFSWQHALRDQDIWLYNDLNGYAVNALTSSKTNRIAVTMGLRL